MDTTIRLFSERLRRLLAGEEGTLPDYAKQYIHNFHAEIEILTSLLRDYEFDMASLMLRILAKEDQFDPPELRAILEEIKSFAYDSENAIDTFLMSIIQQTSEGGSNEICDALPGLQEKITDIKQRLQQVQHIHPNVFEGIKNLHASISNYQASSWLKKRDIVGLDDRMEKLLDLLIEGSPQLSLVALLDTVELDKTAFAAQAYSCNYVKHYFDCQVWVAVSFNSGSNKLLDGIMKSVVPLSKLSEVMDKNYEMKKRILHDFLLNKRFLIVLDDVWGNEVYDDIRNILPDNQNGSRVLTTFSKMEMLTSFKLENGENIRLDLVPAGGPGPLRVTYNGWHFVILYYGSKSFEENISDSQFLPFSSKAIQYSLLPFHLKICCLYLAVFPVHFEISTRQLYQLWIAEGLIPGDNEAIAKEYLEQLINLGLIEVKKRRAGGTIKTCCFPGRWWLALVTVAFMAEFIYTSTVKWVNSSWRNVKRFTAQMNMFEFDRLHGFDWQCLHSLLVLSSESGHLDPMECEEICKRFKMLRVLDLGNPVLIHYPSEIENLFLLKYLKLNIPSLKSLPSSLLCNLLNLYTLDMPSSYIDHTSVDFWKMDKLRHLNFGLITLPAHPGKYSNSLENLNFISTLHPGCCTQDILGRLPNLCNLRICGDLNYYQSLLSKSLCRLSCLESLKLVNESKMPRLSKIALAEYEFPPSITHLSLSNTELMDDPMPTLQKLPHLQVLKLKQSSYLGRKLACGSNGFPKLRVLHLKSMLWLEEWAMEIGAMPKLECLMINPCAYLKSIPEQLWCMRSFKKLELWLPQPELRQKVRDFEDKKQYDIQIYPLGM